MNIKHKQNLTRLSPLMIAILMALPAYTSAQPAEANEQKNTAQKTDTELDSIEVLGQQRSNDEKGKSRVYTRAISNVYIGKKDLDNYRGTSVGDIFKEANGVYAGDARNSGAIDANIRGIQGQGRVPVTIDGTEQSISHFMNTGGVMARSYIDPSMIGGISVEKGPSLTRGTKSGIGGSVIATTLEADDILLPGRKFGIDIKADTGSNSVKGNYSAEKLFGKDYRDIPGAYVQTQVLRGETAGTAPAKQRGTWPKFNGDNRSARLAIAYKDDPIEAVAAYSYRQRGNYFAGRGGSEKYLWGEWSKRTNGIRDGGNQNPYAAQIFLRGNEVPNTSSDLRSLLLKTTLNLPDNQKIKLGYLNTKHLFGETIPWYSEFALAMSQDADSRYRFDGKTIHNSPRSKINNHTYNLQYSWQPEDKHWIDLQAQAWLTRHHSARHQNGDAPFGVLGFDSGWGSGYDNPDFDYTNWVKCFHSDHYQDLDDQFQRDCAHLSADHPPDKLPNTNGRFNIFPRALQIDTDTRWGLNLSNRFAFTPTLALTLSGDVQHEKLRATQPIETYGDGFGFSTGSRHFGPRSGTRREYRFSALMEWQPTDWLNLMAAATYSRYWSYDDHIAEQRRMKNDKYAIRPKFSHATYQYAMLGNDQDARMAAILESPGSHSTQQVQEANTYMQQRHKEFLSQNKYRGRNGGLEDGPSQFLSQYKRNIDGRVRREPNIIQVTDPRNGNKLYYWRLQALMPMAAGKDYPHAKDIPFHNGEIDVNEKVTNPQGVHGVYMRYLYNMIISSDGKVHDSDAELLSRQVTNVKRWSTQIGSGAIQDDVTPIPDKWAPPQKRRNHAWAPMLAATISLSDHIRVYGRYSEAVRFPSLYEDTQTIQGWAGAGLTGDALAKPERTKNWEIGYIHDLTGFFPTMRHADIKLNYYHNTIHNYIDRSPSIYAILQFDRKNTRGIELQARADSGRYFADFGLTYRLKQQVCDADYAASGDIYFNRTVKACNNGGFTGTFSYIALQPKYSLNLSGGMRLLDEKLTLGGRMLYHARASKPSHRIGYNGEVSVNTWNPVLLFDAYTDWKVNQHLSVNASLENITNRYYIDPLARIGMPAPGRTVRVGLSAKF